MLFIKSMAYVRHAGCGKDDVSYDLHGYQNFGVSCDLHGLLLGHEYERHIVKGQCSHHFGYPCLAQVPNKSECHVLDDCSGYKIIFDLSLSICKTLRSALSNCA